ncbi:MAG: glycine cleavage system aminomethyltransferase GcvT [Spirochaetota bacterium]
MKKTALYDQHIARGAKMVEFAGWTMPLLYNSIIDEHQDTRYYAGLFDVSHMGEVIVRGPEAETFLEGLIPTSLDKLYPGKSMYTCFPNEKGGVIDDLFVFMRDEHDYYLVVNAGTTEKDLKWMHDHKIDNVEIIDVSDQTTKIDIQGPRAKEICLDILQFDQIADLNRFHFTTVPYKGTTVMVSQTGYTGEFGYEIFVDNSQAVNMWLALIIAGLPFKLATVGLGARDTLRLEACYSLYGHELSDTITPVEAGLGWLVNSDKNYIGSDVLKKQKAEGAPRALITLEMLEKSIPREGYMIESDCKVIGEITSGGFGPYIKKGIAMALVETGEVSIGDEIDVVIREKRMPAKVVKRPFYKYQG